MSAFRKLNPVTRSGSSTTNPARARLRAEQLEDRTVPANFEVINLADAGAGSLRDAISQANANPGADTITFTGAGASGTILLTSGEIAITDSLTVTGPGADALTISGNKASRIFNIADDNDPDQMISVTLDGLTFADGSSDSGGAILVRDDENLTVQNSTFTGNTASDTGGAIFAEQDLAVVRILNSTFAGNSADGSGGAITVDGGNLDIQHSQFTSNTSDYGGVLFAAHTQTVLINTTNFSENTAAANGGAIILDGVDGPILIQNSTITGNTASGGDGGGLYVAGLYDGITLTIANSTISGNTAGSDGGGVQIYHLDGTVRIVDSKINGNTAGGDGGGIMIDGSSPAADVNILNSDVSKNTANGDDGGGIYFNMGFGHIRIQDSTISGNTVTNGDGGGISVYYYGCGCSGGSGGGGSLVSLAIEHSEISGNTATTGSGGGVFFYSSGFGYFFGLGSISITNSTINKNTADGDGGGLFFESAGPFLGTFQITGNDISDNTAGSSGGGINIEFDTGVLNSIIIADSTISGNTADGDGGGIHFDASGGFYGGSGLQIDNTTVSGNTSGSSGGGIFMSIDEDSSGGGNLTIRNSTISGNTADGDGGGVSFYSENGVLLVQNSTISGNSVTESDGSGGYNSGGGIFVDDADRVIIQNSTIAFNSVLNGGAGGGIYVDDIFSGGIDLESLIISGNTAASGNDLAGDLSVDFQTRFSLIGDSTIGGGAALVDLGNNLLDVDPLLGPLQNNGGFTRTHALPAISPAINAGFNFVATTSDQRGSPFLRTFGPAADIGAFEYQTFASSVTLTANPTSLAPSDTVTLTATVPSLDNVPAPTGNVTFVDGTGATLGTATLVNGVATITVPGSALVAGANSITANYTGDVNFDPSTSPAVTVTLVVPPVPPIPVPPSGSAYGTGGGAGVAQLRGPDGSVQLSVSPYGPDFTGGVRVATGDFNNDGTLDLVVAAGPGLPPIVQVFDGKTGNLLFGVSPFESSFTQGAYVTAGDITGDGIPELIVTPDEGGGPRVIVYSPVSTGGFAKIADFFGISDPGFRGGARAAVADINNDGFGDLIVSAGFGGGPRVAVWDGLTISTGAEPVKLINDIFVFEDTLRNGAFVSGADVDGDGFADLIAGAGPDGAPRVVVFNGQDLLTGMQTQISSFFAGDDNQRNGVPVAVADVDGNGALDLLTGVGEPAPGTTAPAAPVTVYTVASLANAAPEPLTTVDPFPGFAGGVFVG